MAPNINSDYESLWPVIAGKTLPPGLKPNIGVLSDSTSWVYAVKRECVNRAVYYNGPCPTTVSSGGLQASEMIASGASAIPIVGGVLAGIFSNIGAIVAHHAVAVKNEQDAECQVSAITAQLIPQIDAAVAAGQISAEQGVAAHLQVVQKCKAIIAPVAGVGDSTHPCNAGCVFGYFLDALQYLAEVYYMDLASGNLATAPQTYSATSPASVGLAQVFGSPEIQSVLGSPSAGVASTPPWNIIIIGLLVLAALLYFARR